jgi:hypothetical protein
MFVGMRMEESIKKQLREYRQDQFKKGLRETLNRYETVFVGQLRSLLRDCFDKDLSRLGGDSDTQWVSIDSLSSLRSAVGGRFAKLKEHWLGAGLPMKSHRGEETKEFTLDEAGWVELEAYVSERGFVSRLADSEDSSIFYVRPRPE